MENICDTYWLKGASALNIDVDIIASTLGLSSGLNDV